MIDKSNITDIKSISAIRRVGGYDTYYFARLEFAAWKSDRLAASRPTRFIRYPVLFKNITSNCGFLAPTINGDLIFIIQDPKSGFSSAHLSKIAEERKVVSTYLNLISLPVIDFGSVCLENHCKLAQQQILDENFINLLIDTDSVFSDQIDLKITDNKIQDKD